MKHFKIIISEVIDIELNVSKYCVQSEFNPPPRTAHIDLVRFAKTVLDIPWISR